MSGSASSVEAGSTTAPASPNRSVSSSRNASEYRFSIQTVRSPPRPAKRTATARARSSQMSPVPPRERSRIAARTVTTRCPARSRRPPAPRLRSPARVLRAATAPQAPPPSAAASADRRRAGASPEERRPAGRIRAPLPGGRSRHPGRPGRAPRAARRQLQARASHRRPVSEPTGAGTLTASPRPVSSSNEPRRCTRPVNASRRAGSTER